MPHRILMVISLLLGLFLSPRASEAGDWNGTEEIKNGVRHIHNPAEPILGSVVLEPEKLCQLGGFDEADEELFGVIGHILIDERDRVYLLDTQLSEVKVFSMVGEFIRTIGREGEGPGEFRYPTDMLFLPDGKLGVIQYSPSKMVLFDVEGSPAGEYPFKPPDVKGFLQLSGGWLAGQQLALLYEFGDKGKSSWTNTYRLGLFDPSGVQQAMLIEAATEMNYLSVHYVEKEWNLFNQCWTASPAGRVFARVNFTDYKIHVWGGDGELDRIIHRDYQPHQRSVGYIDDIKDRVSRRYRWVPKLSHDIEKYWAPVQDLYPQQDGTLWVRTSRGRYNRDQDIMAGFDVFDRVGRYVQEVTIRGDFDAENDALFINKEYLIVVTDLVSAFNAFKGGDMQADALVDDSAPMMVICYRLSLDKIHSDSGQAIRHTSH